MSVSAKERKEDAHMGPGDSFPVGIAGQHLASAWDLAGHAADPDEVRSNILRFAHEHGLMAHLPKAAQEHMAKRAKKARTAIAFAQVMKAKTDDLKALLNQSYHEEVAEGDGYGKRSVVHFAAQRGLTHLLPDDAHGLMHDMGIRHKHEGITNDDEGEAGTYSGPGHVHTVSKAFAQPAALIQKAWLGEDGATYIEGWISTPDRDLEKDVVQPEAFSEPMDSYFRVGAPVSSEHDTASLPVGHLQKAAIVRNGQVVKSAEHPTDAADFEFFPGAGNGVWGRAKLTDAKTGDAIKQGNVRGFSWIGLPDSQYCKPLAGGGREMSRLKTWNETTVAAYPVNQSAAIMAAKSFGKAE